jgi:hypothetical protein
LLNQTQARHARDLYQKGAAVRRSVVNNHYLKLDVDLSGRRAKRLQNEVRLVVQRYYDGNEGPTTHHRHTGTTYREFGMRQERLSCPVAVWIMQDSLRGRNPNGSEGQILSPLVAPSLGDVWSHDPLADRNVRLVPVSCRQFD